MKQPEWFLSVPLFQPVDPAFCLFGYFEIEGDCDFKTKKFYPIATFSGCGADDLEFIQWYQDWQISYDWDTEKIIISRYDEAIKEVVRLGWGEEKQDLTQPTSQAYETNSIGLYLKYLDRGRRETEDIVVDVAEIAKKFIDASESARPSKGQLELQLIY